MMAFINRILGREQRSSGSNAAEKALSVSDDLINRMRDASASKDPVRALLADIWAQRQNVPYIITMYESNREMKDATQYSDSNRKPGNDNDKS